MHQAARDRAQTGAPVTADLLADDAQLAEPADERPGQLGAFPVAADHRQHLILDEPAHPAQDVELVLGELLTQEEVVRRQRLAEVFKRRGGGVLDMANGPLVWVSCSAGCGGRR